MPAAGNNIPAHLREEKAELDPRGRPGVPAAPGVRSSQAGDGGARSTMPGIVPDRAATGASVAAPRLTQVRN